MSPVLALLPLCKKNHGVPANLIQKQSIIYWLLLETGEANKIQRTYQWQCCEWNWGTVFGPRPVSIAVSPLNKYEQLFDVNVKLTYQPPLKVNLNTVLFRFEHRKRIGFVCMLFLCLPCRNLLIQLSYCRSWGDLVTIESLYLQVCPTWKNCSRNTCRFFERIVGGEWIAGRDQTTALNYLVQNSETGRDLVWGYLEDNWPRVPNT